MAGGCSHCLRVLVALGLSWDVVAHFPGHMNSQVRYLLSNAAAGHEDTPRRHRGEWFEVRTPPIHMHYAEVYWQLQGPFPLPASITARYNGSRAMAITGWESDIVRQAADGSESSVPCYEVYNHHHSLYLLGADAELVMKGQGPEKSFHFVPKPGADLKEPDNGGVPVVTGFNQNSGNEHRQSFHGLPRGVVQPLARPDRVMFHPMIINTRSPHGRGGGPLPRSAPAPPGALYSTLSECPCTTRIKKTLPSSSKPLGSIDGLPYLAMCLPPPVSTLLAENNTVCNMKTYTAGLHCCQHGTTLLDADQSVPEGLRDEVMVKFRVYFEDYDPLQHVRARHLEWSLLGCVAQNEVHGHPWRCPDHAEYDVPQAAPGMPADEAVHLVVSSWTVRDMMDDCKGRPFDPYCSDPAPAEAGGLLLMMASGHCHAPACLEMELRDADTSSVICRIRTAAGHGADAMDEAEFLWEPPCQWGLEADGLRPPPLLKLDTRLTGSARYNATYAHPGAMATWDLMTVYAAEAAVSNLRAKSKIIGGIQGKDASRGPLGALSLAAGPRLLPAPLLAAAVAGIMVCGLVLLRTRSRGRPGSRVFAAEQSAVSSTESAGEHE